MPDKIGHLLLPVKAQRYRVFTKKFAGNHWKTVPQGLKSSDRILYGTAEAVPFVQRVLRSLFRRRGTQIRPEN